MAANKPRTIKSLQAEIRRLKAVIKNMDKAGASLHDQLTRARQIHDAELREARRRTIAVPHSLAGGMMGELNFLPLAVTAIHMDRDIHESGAIGKARIQLEVEGEIVLSHYGGEHGSQK